MALFGSTKNYNSIVAPLKRIEGDLSTYVGDQRNKVSELEQKKTEIDTDIQTAELEVKKSEHTIVAISGLLATDFDGDGEPEDVTQPEIKTEDSPEDE